MTAPRSIPRGSRPCRRGVSLAELLIVLAVLGTVAAIAVPRYGQSLTRHRGESAAAWLEGELLAARELARSSSSTIVVGFTPGSGEVVVSRREADDSLTELERYDLSRDPFNATVFAANFGGRPEAEFSAWGVPESFGTVLLKVGDGMWAVQVYQDSGLPAASRLSLGARGERDDRGAA